MKQFKKLNKHLLGIIFIFFLGINFSCIPIYASNQTQISDGTKQHQILYATSIIWRYKTIDGKLYKRQYDTVKKIWIGSWIPA